MGKKTPPQFVFSIFCFGRVRCLDEVMNLQLRFWLLDFPVGVHTHRPKPVRAGSLRGTCYSFSSISPASLWLLVFILPHSSFSLSFIFYLSCLWVSVLLSKRFCLEITFWYAACSLTLGHPWSLITLTFWQFGNSLFDTRAPSWRVLQCVSGI